MYFLNLYFDFCMTIEVVEKCFNILVTDLNDPRTIFFLFYTFGAVTELLTAVLQVMSLIPARNKYLFLQIILPGLGVCGSGLYECKHTLDRELTPRVGLGEGE